MTTPQTVRALALMQPWASLVASGRKTIELRSWRTHYRGSLVIVASMKAAKVDLDRLRCLALPRPHGVAMAVLDLVDVRAFKAGDERLACSSPYDGTKPGFSWILDNVRALPVPYVPLKAQLGVFHVVDEPTVRAIACALATHPDHLSHTAKDTS